MLLKILEYFNRKRIIFDRKDNDPYLIRYYLFLKNRKHFPFNIFLHNFRKSDSDFLHDHPWPWITIILKGGYWEHTPKGKFWRSPGHIGIHKSKDLHYIELKKNIYPWTLFIVGNKCRNWGFIHNKKWIPHEKYLKKENNNVI